MSKKNILHMISPQENVSPFDVNMACDAGYDVVIPYTSVNLTDVKGLVQDAIFSRSVNNAKKTGIFICGKDASLALDMMDVAKNQWFLLLKYQSFLILLDHSLLQLQWLHVQKRL